MFVKYLWSGNNRFKNVCILNLDFRFNFFFSNLNLHIDVEL